MGAVKGVRAPFSLLHSSVVPLSLALTNQTTSNAHRRDTSRNGFTSQPEDRRRCCCVVVPALPLLCLGCLTAVGAIQTAPCCGGIVTPRGMFSAFLL